MWSYILKHIPNPDCKSCITLEFLAIPAYIIRKVIHQSVNFDTSCNLPIALSLEKPIKNPEFFVCFQHRGERVQLS